MEVMTDLTLTPNERTMTIMAFTASRSSLGSMVNGTGPKTWCVERCGDVTEKGCCVEARGKVVDSGVSDAGLEVGRLVVGEGAMDATGCVIPERSYLRHNDVK